MDESLLDHQPTQWYTDVGANDSQTPTKSGRSASLTKIVVNLSGNKLALDAALAATK